MFQSLLFPGPNRLAVAIPAGNGRTIGPTPFKPQGLAGRFALDLGMEGFSQLPGFSFRDHTRALSAFPDTATSSKGDTVRPRQAVHPPEDGVYECRVRLGTGVFRMRTIEIIRIPALPGK